MINSPVITHSFDPLFAAMKSRPVLIRPPCNLSSFHETLTREFVSRPDSGRVKEDRPRSVMDVIDFFESHPHAFCACHGKTRSSDIILFFSFSKPRVNIARFPRMFSRFFGVFWVRFARRALGYLFHGDFSGFWEQCLRSCYRLMFIGCLRSVAENFETVQVVYSSYYHCFYCNQLNR